MKNNKNIPTYTCLSMYWRTFSKQRMLPWTTVRQRQHV